MGLLLREKGLTNIAGRDFEGHAKWDGDFRVN